MTSGSSLTRGQAAAIDRLREKLGIENTSGWHAISQEMVDEYAGLSGDGEGEWIHLDPKRAAQEAPYGGTIVPGFFQVSHLVRLGGEVMRRFQPFDINHSLNYGFDRLRFIRPMPVGARFRARMSLAEVTPRNAGGVLVKQQVQLELEDGAPTLVAEWLFFLGPQAIPNEEAADAVA